MSLGGRVAIVTGAASGIGRAIAAAPAREGARVAVADLSETGGADAARAITHAVLPHVIRQGHGKIVSIASDAGRVGSTGEAVYSAAKGGLIAFTKTIAREVARHRINVNCVCPGPSDTPLFQDEFAKVNPRLAESLTRVIAWGRLGTPEDVAPAVVFLASDEAGFITGQTLSVSGGLTMM